MPPYHPPEGPYLHKDRLPDIEGYAVLFGREVRVDGKTLAFARNAFDLELARRTDVKACLRHDPCWNFASVRDGSLRLWTDETGLAFWAKLPRGQKFLFLPDVIAEGRTGVSIRFRSISADEDWTSRRIDCVDLHHLGLTTTPAFETAVWLSTWSFMKSPPAHLVTLRKCWLDGQKPPPTGVPPWYQYEPRAHKWWAESDPQALRWPAGPREWGNKS